MLDIKQIEKNMTTMIYWLVDEAWRPGTKFHEDLFHVIESNKNIRLDEQYGHCLQCPACAAGTCRLVRAGRPDLCAKCSSGCALPEKLVSSQ
ncbi:MAG: hypothetical protein HJJLKODD_02162 [Phycisphaerae bacterium]|nr:hypothetical protein [Phycisphaerae bacterium]